MTKLYTAYSCYVYITCIFIVGTTKTRFWNAFLCVKHNLGCPVKGGWSEWNSWSKCTATCGPGIQYRLRHCDHPKPSRTSLNCVGEYVEFKKCFGKLCAAKTNGIWCRWSNWSKCSARQGNGIKVRKRFCKHLNNNSSNTSCFGPHTEVNQCYKPDVDGGWSHWQKWSPCSAKCDRGFRYRMRSCSRPEPERLGLECTGEYIQSGFCHLEPCNGPPIMVAMFDKHSHIKYAVTEKNITLLHIIMRFYSFEMSGILLQRFYDDCEDCFSIQLELIDRRLFLTANLEEHNTTLEFPLFINFGWNEVSFTITKNKATLKLNNHQVSKYIKYIGSTLTANLDQVMKIGKDFEGFVEKLHVNFIPYALSLNNKFSDMYLPYSTYNTIFELSDEQSYSDLSNLVKIPCLELGEFWKLEMYLRFGTLSRGNLALMKNIAMDYMSVEIDNNVIKLKIKLDDYFDEMSINFDEIDSSWIHVEIGQRKNSWFMEVNGEKRTLIMPSDILVRLCNGHLLIGNLEDNKNSTKLQGIIGYLKLNNDILNPNDFVMNPSSKNGILIHNFSFVGVSYNEVTMANEKDLIELNCIINNNVHDDDLDIVWLKSNEPVLHKVICNISSNCIITTYRHASQIRIFPMTVREDNFYLCVSMAKHKIICVYGLKTFENDNITYNVLKCFLFFGKLIVTITILSFVIIVKKI